MINLNDAILDNVKDGLIKNLIIAENKRAENNIELIASENFCSDAVRAACASSYIFKYAEGYPDYEDRTGNAGRYYGGCDNVDKLEQYCCEKWGDVFNTDYHVNVQPHSGSQANMAAYAAVLKPGDTILSMDLNSGGHLTHGSKVNFSGKLYNIISYSTDSYGLIDYRNLKEDILKYEPDLLLVGASAYPREIKFDIIDDILKSLKKRPIFMVDMAHIAGLVAAGCHQSPFGLADIITTTTHKTLRGPRGGLIFCKPELAKKIDSAVFPGTQGGPLVNIIAAKAIAAEEAYTDEYILYIHNVVYNCNTMARKFIDLGYNVVSGGTDNHLLLLDFSKTHHNLTGKMVQEELDKHGITVNKNCVPGEKRSPKDTSGIRIGTAAMTTKGYNAIDFQNLAKKIDNIIRDLDESLPTQILYKETLIALLTIYKVASYDDMNIKELEDEVNIYRNHEKFMFNAGIVYEHMTNTHENNGAKTYDSLGYALERFERFIYKK